MFALLNSSHTDIDCINPVLKINSACAAENNRNSTSRQCLHYLTATDMKITVETLVHAPLAEVWRAYNSPEDIMQWNAASEDWHTTAASVDLRVGGQFSSRMEAKDGSFGFDFAGTYTNIEDQKLIEYAFGDRSARVEFNQTPDGVQVRVEFDAEETHSIEQQREGWQAILNNFTRHVENQH